LVSDGKGNEAEGKIILINKDLIQASKISVKENIPEINKQVILYCAILKKENFELVCQKATEVGVSKIIPVISERTIKLGLKEERLKMIIKEAAEQSGRVIIPELGEPIDFSDAVVSAMGIRIIFDPDGEVMGKVNDEKEVSIMIGPEGGWSDVEIKKTIEQGWRIASLGDLTLRAETAAIIASYLVCQK